MCLAGVTCIRPAGLVIYPAGKLVRGKQFQQLSASFDLYGFSTTKLFFSTMYGHIIILHSALTVKIIILC